eukprot:COSAG01_NODE_1365_length_10560_cov_38.008986_8_plen_474_part_00
MMTTGGEGLQSSLLGTQHDDNRLDSSYQSTAGWTPTLARASQSTNQTPTLSGTNKMAELGASLRASMSGTSAVQQAVAQDMERTVPSVVPGATLDEALAGQVGLTVRKTPNCGCFGCVWKEDTDGYKVSPFVANGDDTTVNDMFYFKQDEPNGCCLCCGMEWWFPGCKPTQFIAFTAPFSPHTPESETAQVDGQGAVNGGGETTDVPEDPVFGKINPEHVLFTHEKGTTCCHNALCWPCQLIYFVPTFGHIFEACELFCFGFRCSWRLPCLCPCGMPYLETRDKTGRLLGSVHYDCDQNCCVNKYSVRDSTGNTLYKVEPETTCGGCYPQGSVVCDCAQRSGVNYGPDNMVERLGCVSSICCHSELEGNDLPITTSPFVIRDPITLAPLDDAKVLTIPNKYRDTESLKHYPHTIKFPPTATSEQKAILTGLGILIDTTITKMPNNEPCCCADFSDWDPTVYRPVVTVADTGIH